MPQGYPSKDHDKNDMPPQEIDRTSCDKINLLIDHEDNVW